MSNLKAMLRSFSINVGGEMFNMSEFTLGLIKAALKDKTVSDMLGKPLTLQIKQLCDRVDDIKGTMINLRKQIKDRYAKIVDLQTVVPATNDNLEQHSRWVNIRVDGTGEHAGEKPMEAVSHLVNRVPKLTLPLQFHEVDHCHRIGPAKDWQGNPRKWPLLLKFTSYGSHARV